MGRPAVYLLIRALSAFRHRRHARPSRRLPPAANRSRATRVRRGGQEGSTGPLCRPPRGAELRRRHALKIPGAYGAPSAPVRRAGRRRRPGRANRVRAEFARPSPLLQPAARSCEQVRVERPACGGPVCLRQRRHGHQMPAGLHFNLLRWKSSPTISAKRRSSRSYFLFALLAFFAGTRARGFSGARSGRSELYIARKTFHDPSACLRQMVRYLPWSSMGAAPGEVKVME